MKKTITITQELEITELPGDYDMTFEQKCDVAINSIKTDYPKFDHKSSAGYQIKSVKNSLKIKEDE